MKDPNEHIESETIISGATLIDNIIWKKYDVNDNNNNHNIWVSHIKEHINNPINNNKVSGLQFHKHINNQATNEIIRATKARYPNLPAGLEVTAGWDYIIPGQNATWTPPDLSKYSQTTQYVNTTYKRPNQDLFEYYRIGINGPCDVYDPPVSYWCNLNVTGGDAFPFRTPQGFQIDSSLLPNSPYQDASQARAFVWRPARWANWMFDIDNYNSKTNNFTFGRGGNQGARGNNVGGDFFIENIFEELDYPGEYFYNETTGLLYFYYNTTNNKEFSSPPKKLIIPKLQLLINMTSTQWDPIKNIHHENIIYRSTKHTYMERHGVPSAGDWALDRFGAIFLQGTETITFKKCIFDRLDGNGIMISGYNRNTTIINNDFQYIGGNAIASWGYTNETDYDPGRPGIKLENAPYAGIDGTDGEHPRFNIIQNNVGREIGLYEKQSSFYVQAKTAESFIDGNVFFNGPRAGINFNDGFGGGDIISNNLVFSTCRESQDHGPLNTWDRQPFLTTYKTGKPDIYMKTRFIHHNFFIDNYSLQESIDNDDGSMFYHSHHNFLIYGKRGLKTDWGGHDNYHYNNVYAYLEQALATTMTEKQLPGHSDAFFNNKVVLLGRLIGTPDCDDVKDGGTIMHNNQYYTPDGRANVCKMSLKDFQEKLGREAHSTSQVIPSDEIIIQWGRELLEF